MLEEYLKIFNSYLEIQDINGALSYIDKIFIGTENIKTKNLFLYLLGCITELPDKYLDYVKTIFHYDLTMPVDEVDGLQSKNFVKSVLFHDFAKARNIYYEYMDNTNNSECRKALLNLLNLANGVKKTHNKIIANLFKERDYYNIYDYMHRLNLNRPTFNNFYILEILLHDFIYKDYFGIDSGYKYNSLIEQIKHKQYGLALNYYQNISCKEEDNSEIEVIRDVLNNIIAEKRMLMPIKREEKEKTFDKEMFLDFLISVADVVEEEGFVILNPENETINKEMRNLTFYIPYLSAYEIGGTKKQVVINSRRNYVKATNDSIFYMKKEAYKKGNHFDYIEYALEHLKYIIPSELDAIKLAQSYFRVGLIPEGLNAIKLAIGIKNYDNKNTYSNSILNYYMMQDYFATKYTKILDKSRQKQMIR